MDDAQGGRRVNVQIKACIHLLGGGVRGGINRLAYAEINAKSRDEISFAYLLKAPYNQRICACEETDSLVCLCFKIWSNL